jgi:hypothetical protein
MNFAVLAISAAFVLPVVVAPQMTAVFLADSVVARPLAPEGQRPFRTLDLAEFRSRFNEAAGSRRVIGMFSPT